MRASAYWTAVLGWIALWTGIGLLVGASPGAIALGIGLSLVMLGVFGLAESE